MIQKFMVEKSGVEKLMVEKYGVEAWGWKVWGWDDLQPKFWTIGEFRVCIFLVILTTNMIKIAQRRTYMQWFCLDYISQALSFFAFLMQLRNSCAYIHIFLWIRYPIGLKSKFAHFDDSFLKELNPKAREGWEVEFTHWSGDRLPILKGSYYDYKNSWLYP